MTLPISRGGLLDIDFGSYKIDLYARKYGINKSRKQELLPFMITNSTHVETFEFFLS